jgi:hypothetical protein
MADPNTLEVRITAQIADLQAGLAEATASIKSFGATLGGVQASASDASTHLTMAAEAAFNLAKAAKQTSVDTKEAAVGITAMGHAAGGARGPLYELMVISHEISAGRMRQALSSTTILLQQLAVPAGLAVGFALAATAAMVLFKGLDGTVKKYEELRNQSQTLGVSIPMLQTLGVASTVLGIKTDDVTNGLGRMDVAFARARGGAKQQADAFNSLGVSLKQNYTTGELFTNVLSGWDKLTGDGPRKVAIATELFGRNGRELIPVLDQLAAHYKEMDALADADGVHNQKAVENGIKLADSFNKLQVAAQGFGATLLALSGDALNTFLVDLTHFIVDLSNWMKDAAKNGSDFRFVMQTLGNELSTILGPMSQFVQIMTTLGSVVVVSTKTLGGWKQVLTEVAQAFGLILNPLGVLLHGIDDLNAKFAFSESLDATVGDQLKQFGKMALDVAALVYDLAKAVDALNHGDLSTIKASLDDMRKRWMDADGAQKQYAADSSGTVLALNMEAAAARGLGTALGALSRDGSKAEWSSVHPDFTVEPPKYGTTSGDPDKTAKAKKEREDLKAILDQELADIGAYDTAAATLSQLYWQGILNDTKSSAQQVAQATKELRSLDLAGEKAMSSILQGERAADLEIVKTNEAAKLAVVQSGLEAQMNAVKKNVEDKRTTLQAGGAQEVALATRETQAHLDELAAVRAAEIANFQAEQSDQTQTTAEHLAAINTERVAEAKYAADVAALRQQLAAKIKEINDDTTEAVIKAANAQEAAMQKATDKVATEWSKTLAQVIEGTKSWTQVWDDLLNRMLEMLLSFTARVIANWALQEVEKTVLSTQGVAIREALETGWIAKMLALVGINVAKWATSEFAKTAATGGAVAVRTAAEVAGSATAAGAAKLSAGAQLGSLVGLAGAGGVASMAAAPFPLDLGAAGFGASMAAAAASFGSIGDVSSAGGLGEVAADGTRAVLHAKETVLPANLASPLRAMLLSPNGPGNAFGGGAGGAGAMHLHYAPVIQAIDRRGMEKLISDHADTMVSAMLSAKRRGRGGFS